MFFFQKETNRTVFFGIEHDMKNTGEFQSVAHMPTGVNYKLTFVSEIQQSLS